MRTSIMGYLCGDIYIKQRARGEVKRYGTVYKSEQVDIETGSQICVMDYCKII